MEVSDMTYGSIRTSSKMVQDSVKPTKDETNDMNVDRNSKFRKTLIVSDKADQGQDWAGYGTFVLPDPVEAPAYIRGQDVDFVERSGRSKFQQSRRPIPEIYKKRPCGFELDSSSMRMGATLSHQKGLASRGGAGRIKEGPHTYLGFTKEGAEFLLKDLRFDDVNYKTGSDPKHVDFDVYNETALRWKYGRQDKNTGFAKGVDGTIHMDRNLVQAIPRGASESGFYAGNKRREQNP